MTSNGYRQTLFDPCVYFKKFLKGNFIILPYVDDILIVGQDAEMIHSLKKELYKSFVMKDLSHAKRILGMNIARDMITKILLSLHEKYIEHVWYPKFGSKKNW